MVLSVIKYNFLGDSKSRRASKSHYWLKSYVNYTEWVDFSHWWSFIRKGVRLQSAQLACFSNIHQDSKMPRLRVYLQAADTNEQVCILQR